MAAQQTSSVDLITVSFRSLDGRRATLEVPSNIEISALKELLVQKFDVPPDQQRLIYRGRVIQPDGILSDYVKESGHTIHVVSRPARPTPTQGISTSQSLHESSSTSQPSSNSASATRRSQSTATTSTTGGQPGNGGMYFGTLNIHRSSTSTGEPQVTITGDLPMTTGPSLVQALMSSFGNLARAPGVQVSSTSGTLDGFPFPQVFSPPTAMHSQASQSQQPSATTTSPTSTSQEETGSTEARAADELVRQFMNAVDSSYRPTTSSTSGMTYNSPNGAVAPFMAGTIPLSHIQQHAEAVSRAAASHAEAVSRVGGFRGEGESRVAPTEGTSEASADATSQAQPQAVPTATAERPIEATGDTEERQDSQEVECVTSGAESTEREGEASDLRPAQEETPEVAPLSPPRTQQAPDITEGPPPTAGTTSTTQQSAAGQPQYATATSTQTFINGFPISMITGGSGSHGGPAQLQPSAVQIAVGALPIGEGANFAQLLSQMMSSVGHAGGPTGTSADHCERQVEYRSSSRVVCTSCSIPYICVTEQFDE